ncbi:hypothetical protein V0U79_11450 [Hyphobacterium sp. HN65]|uniref:Uncharacterized protein n=1 Tax=Hyphobacterium lacteum TaxID=3116575 RepID=A0ABU7LSW1_9PROT|nr:hypothetical protein [Hyphobacterium sp. HN65]MEE2526986.1 hypothetical protein [Hyphobacterium sp. HN65]
MSDDDFTRLLDEIPLLYKVRAFADGIADARLFMRLGDPLDNREKDLSRTYLDGLGFPYAEPGLLTSWDEAAEAAEALDFNPEGWEAEEMLRAGLVAAAAERIDEDGISTALEYVGLKAGEAAQDAVAYSASLGDMRDESVLNAAAGALVQAANGAALVILSESEDEDPPHPFLARWRLFVRGRWPIGLAGSTYNVL